MKKKKQRERERERFNRVRRGTEKVLGQAERGKEREGCPIEWYKRPKEIKKKERERKRG